MTAYLLQVPSQRRGGSQTHVDRSVANLSFLERRRSPAFAPLLQVEFQPSWLFHDSVPPHSLRCWRRDDRVGRWEKDQGRVWRRQKIEQRSDGPPRDSAIAGGGTECERTSDTTRERFPCLLPFLVKPRQFPNGTRSASLVVRRFRQVYSID